MIVNTYCEGTNCRTEIIQDDFSEHWKGYREAWFDAFWIGSLIVFLTIVSIFFTKKGIYLGGRIKTFPFD